MPKYPVNRRNRRLLVLVLILVPALTSLLGAGCATRRPVAVPRTAPPDENRIEDRVATPEIPQVTPPQPKADDFPPLPGANRVYPSQDPRNRAGADAPEAFPSGGVGNRLLAEAPEVPDDQDLAAEAGPADVEIVPADEEFSAGLEPPGAALGPAEDDFAAGPEPVDVAATPEVEDLAAGTEPVEVEGSKTPDPGAPASKPAPAAPPATWSVQLLASSSASVARERAAMLAPYFSEPPRVEPAHGLFRVRVGHCTTRAEAESLRRHARAAGFPDAFVVPPTAAVETPP